MCIPGLPIVLFGFKDINKDLDSLQGKSYVCQRCHNNSMRGIRNIKFFTLFFIPTIPVYWAKELKCGICGNSTDIDSHDIQKLQKGEKIPGI